MGQGGHAEGDRLISVESLVGSRFDDVFGASDGSNRFDGGAGYDTLTYASASRGITMDFTYGEAGEARGGTHPYSDKMANIELLIGSNFEDRFLADEHVSDIDGGAGWDEVDFRGIDFEGNIDGWYGGIIVTADGNDYVVTDRSRTSDVMSVSLENVEAVIGTNDIDSFYGSNRADHFEGADGRDTFYLSGGADFYDGGAGGDKLVGDDLDGVTIDLVAGRGYGGDASGDVYQSIERVDLSGSNLRLFGGSEDNRFTVDGNFNHIEAGGGDDAVDITGFGVTVELGDGDDDAELEGFTSNTRIDGGAGHDTLYVYELYEALDADEFGFVFDMANGEITSRAPGHEDISVRVSNFEQVYGTSGADIFIDEDGTSMTYESFGSNGDGNIFVFTHRDAGNTDEIDDFEIGEDRIDLEGTRVSYFGDLQIEDAEDINWNNPPEDFMYQDGRDAVIVTDGDRSNSIRLLDVDVMDLSANDFIF